MGVIDDIKTNLRNAYTKLETKGATIPAHKNMENLENTIDSIAVAKEEQTKTVNLAMASGNQVVTPDTNKVLSQVTINKPATLLAENIKNGVDIGGVVGSFAGGASLNIHYGNTAPSDTTKLWVKASEPSEIEVSSNAENITIGTFNSFANLPETYRDGCIAKVDNKIYLFGGYSSTYSKKIYCYDLTTNTLTLKNAELTGQAAYKVCAVVDKKVYITGGNNNFGNIYDTETDTITTTNNLSPYPASTNYGYTTGIAAVGKKIYLFGGYISSSEYNYNVYVYDTETDTRSQVSGVSTYAGLGMGVAVVGTDIYLIGGQRHDSLSSKRIEKFNTLSNTLTNLSVTLPTQTAKTWLASAINNKIYCFRKDAATGNNANNNNFIIDVDNLTRENMSFIVPVMYNADCCQDNFNVYFAFKNGSDIYKLPIQINLNENKMLLLYDIFAKFNIINTDTIKVKINPIDCYKGDSNNIGQQVKIALYDSTQQDWVEIN